MISDVDKGVEIARFTAASDGRYVIDTRGPTDVVMKLFGPNSETALIAEDEPMLLAQLRARLAEAWPELAIINEAANGADALVKILDAPYDIVLTDMEMPVIDGPQLIAELQQIRPATAIVGMTGGLAPDVLELEQRRLGIAALLAKPPDLGHLRAIIQNVAPNPALSRSAA